MKFGPGEQASCPRPIGARSVEPGGLRKRKRQSQGDLRRVGNQRRQSVVSESSEAHGSGRGSTTTCLPATKFTAPHARARVFVAPTAAFVRSAQATMREHNAIAFNQSLMRIATPVRYVSTRKLCARRTRGAKVTACTSSEVPSLKQLEQRGVLTLIRRRDDYHTHGHERRGYIEPEKIYLVGVSHRCSSNGPYSSAEAVSTVIDAVQPDAVVVELCRSRTSLLYDEDNGPNEDVGGFGPWVRNLTAMVMRKGLSTLLSAAESKGRAGRKTGAEFVAARRGALKCGADVVLGDRPLHCTLRRAWQSLSVKEKVLLFGVLMRALVRGADVQMIRDEGLREAIEGGVDNGGVVKKYVRVLRRVFPGLVRVLIYERDLYLAWSLKRCEAVRGKRCVVGVIGMGHVEGVLKCLKEDDELRREGRVGSLRFDALVR